MKRFYKAFIVSCMALTMVACGDKDKKDSDDDSKKSSDVSSVGNSAEAFTNLLANIENPAAAMSMDLMSFIEDSGLRSNPEAAGIIEAALMQLNPVLDMDEPVRVVAGGADMSQMDVVAMISIKDGDKFIKLLKQTGLEMDEVEEVPAGFKMTSIKVQDGIRVKMGISNSFCLVNYSAGFANKEESIEKMESIFAMCNQMSDAPDIYKSFVNESNDMAMLIAPENLLNMVPAEMMEKAGSDVNVDQMMEGKEKMKGGATLMAFNFEPGQASLKVKNHYPNAGDMMINGSAMPDEYASLLSNDNLFGFIGGSINMENVIGMLDNVDAKQLDEFKEKTGIELSEMMGYFDGTMSISFIGVPGLDDIIAGDDDDTSADALSSLDKLNGLSDDASSDDDGAEKEDFKEMVITIGLKEEEKIIAILDTVKQLKKEGDVYVGGEGNAYVAIKDGKLMMTPLKPVIDQFVSTGSLTEVEGIRSRMANPFNGYFAFKVMRELIMEKTDGEGFEGMELLEKFDEIIIGGNMEEMEFKLTMTDGSTNALKNIVDMVLSMRDQMGGLPM